MKLTMYNQLDFTVNEVWKNIFFNRNEDRYLIAIGGMPGSGKTSFAKALCAFINKRHCALNPSPETAVSIPMDGFHYTRAQLDTFDDPELAHIRRGAEYTFDGEAYLRLVEMVRQPVTKETETIWAPSFDHAVKDPKENSIAIHPHHKVIILEGNYVLLNKTPWSTAAKLMDYRIFIEAPLTLCEKRLIARHLATGICATKEEAERRAVINDLVNGEEIIRGQLPCQNVIFTKEDTDWAKSLDYI